MPTALQDIARLCRAFADALADRDAIVSGIVAAQRAIARGKLRSMEAVSRRLSEAEEQLQAAIAESPELFVKPRTQTIEGIRVGFRKAPGKLDIPDEARSIGLVRKKLPDQESLLVNITEALDKNALRNLTVRELASIGVTLGEDGDQVAITVPKSSAAKLLDALIAQGREEAS